MSFREISDFLKYLDEVNHTPELKDLLVCSGYRKTVLHAAIEKVRSGLEPETYLEVIRRLIKVNRDSIYFQNRPWKNLPLHGALMNTHVPEEVVRWLVAADKSKSTLLVEDGNGNLPIHKALLFGRSMSTVELVCNCEYKNRILETENNIGHTPMKTALMYDHLAFATFAEEHIRNHVASGIPIWRDRLLDFVKKYLEMRDLGYPAKFRCTNFKSFFWKVFQDAIIDFDQTIQEVIPLIELAVWKGRGLTDDTEGRMAKWVTCGAKEVSRGVAEYLGLDPVRLLETRYARLKNVAEGNFELIGLEVPVSSSTEGDSELIGLEVPVSSSTEGNSELIGLEIPVPSSVEVNSELNGLD